MDDLRRRFASLDAVAAPDLEAEIERRAGALAQATLTRVAGSRTTRRPAVARAGGVWGPRFATVPVPVIVGLLVGALIATLALGAGWWLRSTVVAPSNPATSTPSAVPSAQASPSFSAAQRLRVVAYSVCTRPGPEDESTCAGDWRIWVANADGTAAHELRPDEPGSQYLIAWSPDGSRLLYRSDAWGLDLAITDAVGSAADVLPNESLCPAEARNCRASLSNVAFSPDGSQLAYAIFTASDASGGPCAAGEVCKLTDGVLAVRNMATGRVTRLNSSLISGPLKCCDGYYAPSWSADGTRLAFAMPTLTSFTINVDGSDLRRLMPPGEGGTAPRWSPDGSTISSGLCGVEPTLYLVRPDGGNLRTVSRDGCDFQWTRDGRIVFRDYFPSSTWIMDASGGNMQRLGTTIPALTAAGCIVCPVSDDDRLIYSMALWQPVPADQP